MVGMNCREKQLSRSFVALYRYESMKPEAQQALHEIRSLKRMADYIRCARAELASDPENSQLSTFIALMERLLAQEQARLCSICSDPNSDHVHAGAEKKSRLQQHPGGGYDARH